MERSTLSSQTMLLIAKKRKQKGMKLAPFGIVGFETAFPLLYTKFVRTGGGRLEFLLSEMTSDPAEYFGLPYGTLELARLRISRLIDLEKEREVDPAAFLLKVRNTPFTGWKLYGWPAITMVDGKVVWTEENEHQPRLRSDRMQARLLLEDGTYSQGKDLALKADRLVKLYSIQE